MTELSLVPLDDILDELGKRVDSYVFAYVTEHDKVRDKSQVSFRGGKYSCLGLAVDIQNVISDELRKERLRD